MTRPLIGVQLRTQINDIGARDPAVLSEIHSELSLAPMHWGNVERSAGDYDWSDVQWWDEVPSELMPERIWTIYVVHMNERGPLPTDLRTTAFDDKAFVGRFEAFIEDVAPRAWSSGSPLVVIGNEVDLWADGHPGEVDSFVTFLAKASATIRRVVPSARIVNSLTFDVFDKPNGPELFKRVNEHCDQIAMTWYDLGPDLRVAGKPFDAVVEQMIQRAGGRPVLIKEIGLPTAAVCGSSEERQALRIDEVFDVLLKTDASAVAGACWLGLNDWDEEFMTSWTANQFPGMETESRFVGFLASLGLRTSDGTPKAGYRTWVRRAQELTA